jgi:hypothetical protein
MFRSLKFAALTLVLVILSAPLLAAVTCFGGEAPAAVQTRCPAGCPMMAPADTAPAAQLAAQHSGGPCCNVSSDRPSPVAVLQERVVLSSVVQTISSVTPGLVPATVRAPRQHPQPARFLASSQSLLCVFLI